MEDIITQLDGAKEVFAEIKTLTERKLFLSERYKDVMILKQHQEMQALGIEISGIKSRLAVLRDSIEYVRIKCFIEVTKRYLTKQQMQEIAKQVDDILSAPELHLLSKTKE